MENDMDIESKIKLSNIIQTKRNECGKIVREAEEEVLRVQGALKVLQDLETEIENEKEDDLPAIGKIINGMGTYCNLFNGKCSVCYFNVSKRIKSNKGKIYCAFNMIKTNLEDPELKFGEPDEKHED